ncbi:major facilitator family transporter [Klebsiella pneumoniae]|uniref:Major facilitator family transporter n=1 Tax=Klebsiella pneumoniae TaxID=573 RepID=A0A447RN24_KLEPN|nr:major facilitator family transporter [Klebsiella pneumoniae]
MEINAIPRRLAFTAGGQQLINWGISFYMPGTFAGAIAADKGWSLPQIYLGLTLAMLMMAAVSPFVARLLARFGGRLVGHQRYLTDSRQLRHDGPGALRWPAGTAPGC